MKLELGGKCLAFHGPLLYEAKILKIWDADKQVTSSLNVDGAEDDKPGEELALENSYFVHYQGWKASWDEWIGLDRIKEYNDENVELKKKLTADAKNAKKEHQKMLQQQKKKKQQQHQHQQQMTSSSGSHASSNLTTSSNNPSATVNSANKGSSNSNTPSLDSNNLYHSNSPMNFSNISNNIPRLIMHIPVKLKCILVNDWEFITKDKKILKLPSDLNILQILTQFQNNIMMILESPASQSQLAEYCNGLKLYFEHSLPILLLYRLERLQYEEIKDKSNPIEIYGSIHLLRLLSILPELIGNSLTMDKQSSQLIIKQSEQLLNWLMANDEKLHIFPHDYNVDDFYVNTSSQYEGVALGM